MVFPLLLLVLGLWALVALRDRPPKEYVRLYWAGFLLTVLTEGMMIRFFRVYEWHMQLIPDANVDSAATSLYVAMLDPLLGLVYVRYCRGHPVVTAIAAALPLAALEYWMLAEGYMIYRRFWHPLLTAGLFSAFFLLLRLVATRTLRIPRWVDTHGLALWSGFVSDVILGVMVGLWAYQAHWTYDHWQDGRLLSFLLHGLIYCPLATIAAAAPLKRRWAWAAGAVVLMCVAEGAAWSYGLLIYHGWSVGLSLVRWAAVVGATALYAAWMRKA